MFINLEQAYYLKRWLMKNVSSSTILFSLNLSFTCLYSNFEMILMCAAQQSTWIGYLNIYELVVCMVCGTTPVKS